jgi:hypothetical protein
MIALSVISGHIYHTLRGKFLEFTILFYFHIIIFYDDGKHKPNQLLSICYLKIVLHHLNELIIVWYMEHSRYTIASAFSRRSESYHVLVKNFMAYGYNSYMKTSALNGRSEFYIVKGSNSWTSKIFFL